MSSAPVMAWKSQQSQRYPQGITVGSSRRNLLASLDLSLLMRATGQAEEPRPGLLDPEEAACGRRLGAILGEWLGGLRRRLAGLRGNLPRGQGHSRGGRERVGPRSGDQPGPLASVSMSCSTGRVAIPAVTPEFQEALAESLVLVHGGMAQNVGPDPEHGDREVPAPQQPRSGRRGRRRSRSSRRSFRPSSAGRCAGGQGR